MVFDRFKERMRQGTGLSKDMGHFKGTDNARVDKMFSEAETYAARLKSYKKHLHESMSAVKSLLESTNKTLSADLPQVWTHNAEGAAMAQYATNNSGQSVRISSIPDLVSRHEAELKSQVIAPIDNWLAIQKEFHHKLSKLNNFRLDLDTARRQHNRSDLERVRHQQKSDKVPDQVHAKLQEQSTDLQGKRDAWMQYESEVHAELMNLVNEAGTMHIYAAKALSIQADILSSALPPSGGELGQPLPSKGSLGARLSNPRLSGSSGYSGSGPIGQAAPSGPHTGAFPASHGSQTLADPGYVQMST